MQHKHKNNVLYIEVTCDPDDSFFDDFSINKNNVGDIDIHVKGTIKAFHFHFGPGPDQGKTNGQEFGSPAYSEKIRQNFHSISPEEI